MDILAEVEVVKKTSKNTNEGMALGMCFGVAIGTSLGVAFDGNIALGTSIGLSIGLVLGLAIGSQKDKAANRQIEEKGYTIRAIEKREGSKEYAVTVVDRLGEETVIIVSEGQMEEEHFSVGDIVFFNEDGQIEQAFDKEDEP